MTNRDQGTTEVNKVMSCTNCQQTCTEHQTLACMHTLCQTCMTEETEKYQKTGVAACPVCAAKNDSEMPSSADSRKSTSSELCVVCDKEPSVILCCHCNRHLCSPCHDACKVAIMARKDELLRKAEKYIAQKHREVVQVSIAHLEYKRQVAEAVLQIRQRADAMVRAVTDAAVACREELLEEYERESRVELERLKAMSDQLMEEMRAELPELSATDVIHVDQTETKLN